MYQKIVRIEGFINLFETAARKINNQIAKEWKPEAKFTIVQQDATYTDLAH